MGAPGPLPWRAPAGVVYIPGVSFKPRAEAGSRPSPAVPGQSPVKICWRTMAGKAAAPRPAPPLLRGGDPALHTGPSPSPAGFLDRCPQRGGDARPLPATQTPRPRSPLFSTQPRHQECETSFQSPTSIPVPAPARLGTPTSAPADLPLSRGRRRRRGGRKNTGKLLSYLQRARAHTHIFPLGSAAGRSSPVQALPLMPLRFLQTYRKRLHTPLDVPRSYGARSLPRQFTHKQLNRTPTSHFQKCAFSLEIQMHKLTPPSLATLKSGAFPSWLFSHTGAQLRVSPKEERETEGVLARSFPPSRLSKSLSCPARGVQN